MLEDVVVQLGDCLKARAWMMATAESCTGGLVGHTLTNVAGSSQWYLGGIISYANALKTQLLGVDTDILERHGAVSEPCVRAMAQGVCRVTGADVGVALSGIAGPSGGTSDKPVGTVWIGWHVAGQTKAVCEHFAGTRDDVKHQSARAAIFLLMEAMTTR
ncbi:MAG: damage-inducible protein CinA [Deltaproteobacteria bacterium]|nr:MAG: damage-inducible protein CinA [Deltaproteobacteria bacterium]